MRLTLLVKVKAVCPEMFSYSQQRVLHHYKTALLLCKPVDRNLTPTNTDDESRGLIHFSAVIKGTVHDPNVNKMQLKLTDDM